MFLQGQAMTGFTRRAVLGQTALLSSATAVAALAEPAPKSKPRPTLIQGADLLTMDPKLGEIERADVLISQGKITAIGPNLKVADAEIVPARGMILMPGMCDGHRHLWQAIDLGAVVKTEPQRYRTYGEWKARLLAALTPEEHYLGALVGGLLAIDSGVTSVVDNPGQVTMATSLAAARGARDSGIGGWHPFQMGLYADFKPGDTITQQDIIGYVRPATARHWTQAEAVRELFNDSTAPMQFGLGPANLATCPIDGVKAEYARARAMGVKLMPVHQTPVQHSIRVMHQAGLLGPEFHIAHGNDTDAQELKMMADNGCMIVATAMGEVSYVSIGRRAPVHGRARAAGVKVGIGMDVPVALSQDYFEHLRAAFWSFYLEPEGYGIAGKYTSTQVLELATSMGADAMRLGDVTGTITVGKRADLVLLRTDRLGFAAGGSLADRVVNFAALQDVDSVWIMGRARKRGGRMVGVDMAGLKTQLATAKARFQPLADSLKITA
jgi:cytosine/adenosine deaminase-related metal-dependent hydrolase